MKRSMSFAGAGSVERTKKSPMTGGVLLDTSAAVALCTADHVAHLEVISAIGDRESGLAGHAWFETFSVLTRLPAPQRRSAGQVLDLL